MAEAFPHIDFRREVTIGHLLADIDTAHGLGGKVNPPLRPREDVEALWEHLLDGNDRLGRQRPRLLPGRDEVRRARATTSSWPSPASAAPSTCCPAWSPRGAKRGLSLRRIAELTSLEPRPAVRPAHARARSPTGYDADIALVDPARTWTVRAEDSESTQEYTPFEGFELTAKVDRHLPARSPGAARTARSSGDPQGRYLPRPRRSRA